MKKHKIPAIIALITLILLVCSGCVVEIAVPEVKEGYFDVSVTYEINGEVKNYYGVYVCEYIGTRTSVYGSRRMWDYYVEGADDVAAIIVGDTYDGGVIYIDFGYYPDYLMSDPDCTSGTPEVNLYVTFTENEYGMSVNGDEEEIFEKYGVKVISYYYDSQIENTYTPQWSISQIDPSIN